jgi:hypothetical protein
VVEIMKATLAFHYKEIDPFTYANERELELFDLYLFETAKPRTELENYESLKIQNYVERYGFLPPGNTKILNHNRAAVSQATFKKLFEYD